MRTLLRYAATIFIVAVVIQLFPVTRDNPPITGTIEAPAPIMAALRRSCFDCHSNETVWPWYSRVAPAKWLVANDVHSARSHLNFSEWATTSALDKQRLYPKIAESVERGSMPPGVYTPMHPEARLSLQEITALSEWARAAVSR